MNVAETVGATLAAAGVRQAFGVVGSGNFTVTNALIAGGVSYAAARGEHGAASMADAYARVSGTVSVLSVHQGPGLTNAITGITEAAKSRTPLVVLAGQATQRRSNFWVDQDAIACAVGAEALTIGSAASASADAARAFAVARDERRTVLLNLPLDVQEERAPAGIAPVPAPPPPQTPRAQDVSRLADALQAAQRPVFIAGRGARSTQARDALCALAENTGALLATSAVARGLFRDDRYYLGTSGGFASPLAAELIRGADLVVGWGCALNMWTTRHGSLIGPDATVGQVDLDADAIGSYVPVQVPVVGDAGAVAEALSAELRRRGHAGDGYRSADLRQRIANEVRWQGVPYTDGGTDDAIDPRTLTIALDDMLPAERIVAIDSGNFMGYPAAFLDVPDENGMCFTQAYQSIGLGLGTAIGAALARPDRLPIAALGDGGALMAAAELETVVRLGIPMLIVVYDDAAYSAEVYHFAESHQPLDTVTFPDADIASIARGFGLAAVTARRPDELAAIGDWLAGPRDRPMLVDAKVTRSGPSWWLEEAFRGH